MAELILAVYLEKVVQDPAGHESRGCRVNAVVDAGTVVFRTGEGTKLAAVTIARQVAVDADGYDAGRREAWSVVVAGNAVRLDNFDEINQADELPLPAWTTHPKQWFVRVPPSRVSGRRFTIAGAAPDE
ncbi:pyridoxamine 5'-phosphate oxidase family protein [Phytoactinopolyspora alkaliphila]|uniref:Pyridoxamine 5'-phosphate oxidase family protein n=1 Tax=Phytoactinopolyspora alkaliphila TaxID=1783498 RepID=A0A6N9YSX5_9ACTN|nr:pyridoxamine 5'-phosphate oxidase family protein [Phytoactinopolyspora alkaliphila]NED98146.1 pyridoxamine 5'-phosphate oxidase family protein [Phytoactinopolyspora alkaliphila]